MRTWTKDEEDFIRANYGEMTAAAIGIHLGVSRSCVKNRITKLGIKLPEDVRLRNCAIGQRVKGNIPHNKGKKLSESDKDKYRHTFFKKGNKPHNHVAVGTVLVNSLGYVVQKVAEPNKWQFVHRMVWEQLNGEIPKGYNIQFKDKNRLNVNPSNLHIVNKRENMLRNSIMNYPPEIRELIRLTSKLNRKTIEYGEKQDE